MHTITVSNVFHDFIMKNINRVYKKELYASIESRGVALPSYTSKTITIDYLNSVKYKEVFLFYRENWKEDLVVNVPREEIFEEFKESAVWGFDEKKIPDKCWLVQACYQINPNHPIFVTQNQLVDDVLEDFGAPTLDSLNRIRVAYQRVLDVEAQLVISHRAKRLVNKKQKFRQILNKMRAEFPFLRLTPDIQRYIE